MEQISQLKEEGNAHFRLGEYEQAKVSYTEAIFQTETSEMEIEADLKAALFANRAACYMSLKEPEPCLNDCDRALSLKTPYPRVRCRRYWALRKLDKKNDALTELKKALEEDPSLSQLYAKDLKEIEKEAAEETERMKNEALGQLKELGNKFLGLFGMSTDNFQMQKNPDGGYSVQFKQ